MQHITPTRTSRVADLVLGLVFTLGVVGCIALAQADDAAADAELEQLAAAERAELARQHRLDHMNRMAAYEAGMSDAMDAVRRTPEGLALVQVCLALNERPVAGH